MFRKFASLALALTLITPAALMAATPVNVNTATAKEIAKSLDGVGQTRAQAIVDWRGEHGPFKKADDLRHVKGIGKATIERNRSAIQLADDSSAAPASPKEPVKAVSSKKEDLAEK